MMTLVFTIRAILSVYGAQIKYGMEIPLCQLTVAYDLYQSMSHSV